MTNRFYSTAEQILNDVAVDTGMAEPVTSPVGSTDKQFVQLTRQLNIGIEELALAHSWQQFKREATLTTDSSTYPDGVYDLPSDFHFMINQTHWDRTNDLPVNGPLSSQAWAYLKGRDLASTTIYASFRQNQGKLALWPEPPTDGLTIAYEYASTNWVLEADGTTWKMRVTADDDIVALPPQLVRNYLKNKYLAAKGFDAMEASVAVAQFLDSSAGKDSGAPILSAGRRRSNNLIDPIRNLPDTGYGS